VPTQKNPSDLMKFTSQTITPSKDLIASFLSKLENEWFTISKAEILITELRKNSLYNETYSINQIVYFKLPRT